MKSLHTKIISALTIAIMCVSLCACGETHLNEENCDNGHNLVQISYTAPTCKTSGQRISKCRRCEYTETEQLLPIDHDYKIIASILSTCATHGSQTVKCSMCYNEIVSELPLLNHNYELISETPSTCAIKGVKNYKCKDCQDTYLQELELLRHNYKTVNTATCFLGGELKNICNDCQHEEVIEDTAMFKHNFDTDGYCSKCGVYKTLFNEDELNVTWRSYPNYAFDNIHGYMKPKFKENNTIPDEYFVEHIIFLNLSFYGADNVILGNKTFSSFIIPWDGLGHKGKPTINTDGGLTNAFSYEFMLNLVADNCFEDNSILTSATSFKIELSCDGYKTIEKTYFLD